MCVPPHADEQTGAWFVSGGGGGVLAHRVEILLRLHTNTLQGTSSGECEPFKCTPIHALEYMFSLL